MLNGFGGVKLLISEIIPSVIRVRGEYKPSIGYPSSYILLGDGEIAIIDTGTLDFPRREILKPIEKRGYNIQKHVKMIIITHPHPDHIGGLKWLKNKTKAEVAVFEGVQELLRKPSKIFENNFKIGTLSKLKLKTLNPTFDYEELRGVDVDHPLEQGETLTFGDHKLRVYHTGGHCFGHIVLYDPSQEVLFAGDEVLCHPQSPLKFFIDLTGNVEKREHTLKVLNKLNPKYLLPAHDEPRIDEQAKIALETALEAHNIWEETVKDAVKALNKGKLSEIGEYVRKLLNIKWTQGMDVLVNDLTTLAFLKHLEEKGKVERIKDKKDTLWKSKNTNLI